MEGAKIPVVLVKKPVGSLSGQSHVVDATKFKPHLGETDALWQERIQREADARAGERRASRAVQLNQDELERDQTMRQPTEQATGISGNEDNRSGNLLDAKASRRTVLRWGLRAAAVAAGSAAGSMPIRTVLAPGLPKADVPPAPPQSSSPQEKPTSSTITTNSPATPTYESGPNQTEEFLFVPESIHGVDVFGLKEKITKQDQIDKLYQHFDDFFEEKLPEHVRQKDRFEQRDYLLDPNERHLEVVVRQSAYQQFLERQRETGVDLVDWMRMHVDVLNRCIENAKPPSSLRAKLLRVVVVDDNFVINPSKYSKDLDATWFIDKDYRGDPKKENNSEGYFWSFNHDKDGNVIFRWPPGGEKIEKTYKYPPKQDSLTGKNGVWLDFGLTHEWSHQLLNLPDEYLFDVDTGLFQFKQFFFATGNFVEPWLSPNLSYLLQRNQRERIRGYYTHPKGYGVMGYKELDQSQALHPKDIRIECRENNKTVKGRISLHQVRYEGDYYSRRSFLPTPDQLGNSDLKLDENLLAPTQRGDGNIIYPLNMLLRFMEGETLTVRELFLPVAVFNMSKIARVDQANYTINFTGYEDRSKRTQIVKLVDDSELESFLDTCEKTGDQPYAQMKVDGTPTTFLWFLRD